MHWEPNNSKLAVLTLSNKKSDGKAQYTVAANRSGLDIYEMYHDKQTGFMTQYLGAHPAEKVTDCSWSPAGDIMAV